MKNMRRLAALALAAAMTMAMSITAFADEATTITVNNVKDASLKYSQVIVADTTTSTGWDIVDAYVPAFKNILGETEQYVDEQQLIQKYIDADSEALRAKVIDAINPSTDFGDGKSATQTLTLTANQTAGLYVISAVQNVNDDTKEFYSYKNMAAYIGFEQSTGKATSLVSAVVNAKSTSTTLDKELTSADDDTYVEIGSVVSYTINTKVPYIVEDNIKADTIVFGISDKLTGATYDSKNLNLVVKMGETTVPATDYTVTIDRTNTQLSIDLSKLVVFDTTKSTQSERQPNANKSISITYNANVTSLVVNNEAKPVYAGHENDENITADKVYSYTGALEVTKTGDVVNGTAVKLAGAQFVITKTVKEDNKDVVKYAQLDSNKNLVGWGAEEDATPITTGDNGVATAYGFDKDTTYSFVEVVAPTGYKVDDTPQVVNTTDWVQTKENDETTWVGSKTVADTKLASLPFTGGMGTTIFTVLGVAIMALAAALYFASKRSAAK